MHQSLGAPTVGRKLVAASKAGVSPWDLYERAWAGRASFSESWPRQDFAILGFAALSVRCSAKAGPKWVKLRKARNEHMVSTRTPITDMCRGDIAVMIEGKNVTPA
jgi:hypothetical protein